MITTETQMYADLRKHFKSCFLQRIETGAIFVGVPDLFFRNALGEGWIEMKILQRFPLYAKVKIPFRPGQFNWLQRYSRIGGNAILLIYMIETRLYYLFRNENIQIEYENKRDFLNHASVCKQMRMIRKDDLCPAP